MNEISEKKPLWIRAKGAILHRMRQWAKDLLLFRILPGEYRRAAKQPIQPGKVVFLENKEPTVPESFEVLYRRLSRVPELDVEFMSLGETRVRLRQYYRNCIEAVRDLATAQCVFLNDAVACPQGAPPPGAGRARNAPLADSPAQHDRSYRSRRRRVADRKSVV